MIPRGVTGSPVADRGTERHGKRNLGATGAGPRAPLLAVAHALLLGLLLAGCGGPWLSAGQELGPAELWLTDDTVLTCERGVSIGVLTVECHKVGWDHRVSRQRVVGYQVW